MENNPKNNEMIFKIDHLELEFDRKNIHKPDIINYYEFLEFKYKIKSIDEEPNEEYREQYNKEVT